MNKDKTCYFSQNNKIDKELVYLIVANIIGSIAIIQLYVYYPKIVVGVAAVVSLGFLFGLFLIGAFSPKR